jgi:hypothetical protein
MQHFGRPLRIELDTDEHSAHMIIGRVIPQQPHTSDGQDAYGAHYRLDLRREHGVWKISHFDYRPGWITSDQRVPHPLHVRLPSV